MQVRQLFSLSRVQWSLALKRAFLLSMLAVALGAFGPGAFAQDGPWPSRPIKVIVPFPAGSAADVAARIVMQPLSRKLGQPILVENRPGAAGTLGSSVVAHAKPDGYTLLVHSSSHTLTAAVYADLNYDPAADLVGVVPLSFTSTVFVTGASKGYHTLADLVNAAKWRPGTINYASAGNGTVTHLAGEGLRMAGGFQATHVPFKGTVEAISDLVAGRVDYFLAPLSMVLPMIHGGQLVALATVDAKRSKLLPDVPTAAELGYPNLTLPIWMGLFAPGKTPVEIVERLNAEVNGVLSEPEIRARIEATGSSVNPMSQKEFGALLSGEFERNAGLVRAAGIKPQ